MKHLILVLLAIASALQAADATKPNVVYIMADDLGWGDISAHGGGVPTPNIDRLFSKGVELTQFMGWCVCSPTRAMLLTGRRPIRVGTGPETGGELEPEETTIAEGFKANGYRTGIFGKWHNGNGPETPKFSAHFAEAFKHLPNKKPDYGHGVNVHGFDEAWVYYGGGPDHFTRRTAEQTGIVGNDLPLRDKMPDVVTLPQLCKEAGWQSHAFGKLYHLGGGRDAEAQRRWMDAERSWHTAQRFEATKVGKKMIKGRNVAEGALSWCAWGAADGTDEDQPDGQIAAATVAMIEKLGNTPWFIGCGFMKPHDPFIAPKKYFDLYPPESLKPWTDPADMRPVRKECVGFGDYATAFGKFTSTEWLELLRAYCAATSFMDAQLGRVLDALDKGKLWHNTIVIFVGDHGYHTGERQWWNKNTLFERSCRAPLIIAAPGMKGGQTTRSLVEFVDLYPTITDFCSLPIPHTVAGTSLRPVLTNPSTTIKDAAFTFISRSPKLHAQSIRTTRWRFTRWSDGQTELYDHDTDPEELHEVSAQNPDVIADLTPLLQQLPALSSKP